MDEINADKVDVSKHIQRIKEGFFDNPNSKGPQSRPSQDKKVEYLGETKKWTEVQSELNALSPSERIWTLTENNKQEVCRRLKAYRDAEDLKDGLCLYEEYREQLSDKFEDFEDRDESYWVSGKYLKQLHTVKEESSFWDDLDK